MTTMTPEQQARADKLGIKVSTSFIHPPIPVRNMDWSAIDENTFDCDCDESGFFRLGHCGHGATESEAIDELLEMFEED